MSESHHSSGDDNDQNIKKVAISGTHNRYEMKKVTTKRDIHLDDLCKEPEKKKRVVSVGWSFSQDNYEYEKQIDMIKNIKNNQYKSTDEISKIALQEINKKICGYKQQDLLKKKFDQYEFINVEVIINKMAEHELKCHYCLCKMNVLYDISREMKQWSVDRINNDLGHNKTNFYLSCLECNLKRRRRNDESFLFTKQLKLVKTVE
jgi:hypothetical protein